MYRLGILPEANQVCLKYIQTRDCTARGVPTAGSQTFQHDYNYIILPIFPPFLLHSVFRPFIVCGTALPALGFY